MYRTPGYDSACTKCSLSTGKAIHSFSINPFNKALLYIISDYPSSLEEKTNIPLSASNDVINGGRLLHTLIKKTFDEDPLFPPEYKPFYNYIVFANAIRCNPNRGKTLLNITYKDICECKSWLNIDLNELNPNIPILISGSKAASSLMGRDTKVLSNRKTIHYINNHPALICENFAITAQYLRKEVTNTYKRRKDGIEMPSKKDIKLLPPTLLDPTWCLTEDLKIIKKLIISNI